VTDFSMAMTVALCEDPKCEWSAFARDEEQRKVLSVLHTLTRHPELYAELTGKDPSTSVIAYKEAIREYRRYI
jgi:hypothetical protein